MQVFNKKFTDDFGVFFLLVALVDVGGSKILLEGEVNKAIERFAVFINATLDDQARFFLYQSDKAPGLCSLFCYPCDQLPFSEEVLDIGTEKTRGNIKCPRLLIVIRGFFLRAFMQHKT